MRSVLLFSVMVTLLSCTDRVSESIETIQTTAQPEPFCGSQCVVLRTLALEGMTWQEQAEVFESHDNEKTQVRYRTPVEMTGRSMSLDDPRVLNDRRLPDKSDRLYDQELIRIGLTLAKKFKAVELKFPKRTYRIVGEVNKDHLIFNEVNNLVINGQGSKLMFLKHRTGIRVRNSKNLVLKNFVIDYPRRLSFPGHIEQKQQGTFFVLDPNVEINSPPQFASFLSYNTTMRRWVKGEPRLQLFSLLADDAKKKWKYNGTDFIGRHTWKFLAAVGRDGKKIKNIPMNHRVVGIVRNHSAAIALGWGTQWIKIEDVTIHSSPGIGILMREGLGGYRLERIKIVRRPDDASQLLTTSGGGLINMGHRGHVSMVDCVLQHMGDDGINTHGLYHPILSRVGTRGMKVGEGAVRNVRKGDLFDFVKYGKERKFERLGRARVVDIQRGQEVELTFDRDLPDNLSRLRFLNRAAAVSNYIVRDSRIEENRARALWMHTGNGAIVNNSIAGQTWGGIYLTADPYLYNAGPGAFNTVVKKNAIARQGFGNFVSSLNYTNPNLGENASFGNGLNAAIRIAARMPGGDGLPKNAPLRGITIEDNEIEDAAGLGLLVASATDVAVRGNTFTRVNTVDFAADADACGAMMVYRARDVVEMTNGFFESLRVCFK